MNRIVAIAIATIIPAAASTATAAEPRTQAPRVNAAELEATRDYVRSVGILGMLSEGSAAATVLSSTQIGSELDRAVSTLQGRRFAAGAPAASVRAGSESRGSVSIGAVEVSQAGDIELAEHRAHRPAAPESD